MDSNDPRDRLGRALGRLYLVLCLAYMAWILWATLLPEHRRLAMRLRLLKSSAQVTNRLARRTGAASIRQEALTGRSDYTVPYQLSLAREAFERAYDRARGAL